MFDTISNRSNTSSIFEGLLGSASASSRASAAAKSLEARSFSEEMQETQASDADVAAAASVPDTVTAPAGSQPTGNDQNSSRQDSATAQNSSPAAASGAAQASGAKASASTPASTSTPSTPSTGAASTDTTGNAPKTPIEILQDVMKAQGIDPGKYKMESFEELVMYPGGSFMHRYTQVDLPNGYQEKFSTDLMAKFPEVTVNELSRIMKMGADGPLTGLV